MNHVNKMHADKRGALVMQMFLFSCGLFVLRNKQRAVAPPASPKKKKERASQVHASPIPAYRGACSAVKFLRKSKQNKENIERTQAP